jgi:hypothetical protein
MSAKVMGRVWELDIGHPEQTVLLAMADHASHDGTDCYPSIGLLTWKTGYSRRQVQRLVHKLEDAEILVRAADAGDHRPCLYEIVLDGVPSKEPWKVVKERELGERREEREDRKRKRRGVTP